MPRCTMSDGQDLWGKAARYWYSTAKHAHSMHDGITRTDNVSVVGGDTDNAEGGLEPLWKMTPSYVRATYPLHNP